MDSAAAASRSGSTIGMKAYPARGLHADRGRGRHRGRQGGGRLDRIAAIEIATTRRGYQTAGSEPEKWAPDTRDTADHSLPYVTARAMFDGDITNDSYAPEKLHDPRILALMRKITVREDSALTARLGKRGSYAHHRDPRRWAAHRARGRRCAGLRGPTHAARRRRAEIPRQCRQALAGRADRNRSAGAVGARSDGRYRALAGQIRGAGKPVGRRLFPAFTYSLVKQP